MLVESFRCYKSDISRVSADKPPSQTNIERMPCACFGDYGGSHLAPRTFRLLVYNAHLLWPLRDVLWPWYMCYGDLTRIVVIVDVLDYSQSMFYVALCLLAVQSVSANHPSVSSGLALARKIRRHSAAEGFGSHRLDS